MKPNFTIAKIDTKDAVKSVLRLFNVPWTSNQTDTMIFKWKEDQAYYFGYQFDNTLTPKTTTQTALSSVFKLEVTQSRPFRIGEPFRVKTNLNLASRFNYFEYIDTLTTRHWYGFITNVQWINSNLVQLNYTVDPIQTYLFDCIVSNGAGESQLVKCLVERETTNKDGYFYNLEKENVYPSRVVANKTINLFTQMNGSTNTNYYLLISKYYLFCEDLGNDAQWDPIQEIETVDFSVKFWKSPTWYTTAPNYLQTYGHSEQTLFYYVIQASDLDKTISFIQTLQSKYDIYYKKIITGVSSSKIENLMAIIPIPNDVVQERTTYPEYDLLKNTSKAKYYNKFFYHVADPNQSTTETPDYESTAAINKLKDCLNTIWGTQWYRQYTLKSPYTALLTQISFTLPYSPKNSKVYSDETISIAFTGFQESLNVPISKLVKSTTPTTITLSLYVYVCVSSSLHIILSSTPITNWGLGTDDKNYEVLAVSTALSGTQYVSDATVSWKLAEKANNELTLSLATKLIPNMQTSMIGLVSAVNSPSISPAMVENARKAAEVQYDIENGNLELSDYGPAEDYQMRQYEAIDKEKWIQQEQKRTLNAITPISSKIKKASPYIFYALSTTSELISFKKALLANRQAAMDSAGQVITQSTNSLVPYNLGWPQIIISLPSNDSAEQLDNYFNMFGYAINKYKKAELFSRAKWNYLKTTYSHIEKGAPADARNAIQTLFNNGIRFHHDKFYEDLSVENPIAT